MGRQDRRALRHGVILLKRKNVRFPSSRMLDGGRFNFFHGAGGETVSPIIGDRPIDDRTTVETFPGIEDQKKVREPFQDHQSVALRAIHNEFLPRYAHEPARGISNL